MTIHSPLCIRFRSVFMGTQWRPLTRRWERWRARAAATRPRRTRTPSPARDSATRVLWRRRHPRPTPSTAPRRRSFGSTPTHHCASTRHRDGLWAIPPPAILLLFPPPRLMANPPLPGIGSVPGPGTWWLSDMGRDAVWGCRIHSPPQRFRRSRGYSVRIWLAPRSIAESLSLLLDEALVSSRTR